MRPWRRNRKTHCPLCGSRLIKDAGKLNCPTCRIVLVGDSCRFIDLPQFLLGRNDTKSK
jgi:hypothetical protein